VGTVVSAATQDATLDQKVLTALTDTAVVPLGTVINYEYGLFSPPSFFGPPGFFSPPDFFSPPGFTEPPPPPCPDCIGVDLSSIGPCCGTCVGIKAPYLSCI